MAAPSFIATRVYLKPLLPTRPLRNLDLDYVLRRAKRDLLRRVKGKLLQTTFSDRAKKALAEKIRIEIKPSSLRIVSNHPAFAPLLRGQKSGQMTWLTKARRPIPIITESGELIFRNATARSMANGHWFHPGRKPSDFVDKAKAESRAFLKQRLREDLKKQVRAAWGRAR